MGYTPPQLEVRKVAGGYYLLPPSTTSGDDLTIFANQTDATAYIKIDGIGSVTIKAPNAGGLVVQDASANLLNLTDDATDNIFLIPDNKNFYLKTGGTGLLKFGAYTAGAATDSTGYITILDAAGNTRKLMVQA